MFGVNPETATGLAEPLPVNGPGLLVTVYDVTVPDGGVKETLIVVELDAVPDTEVGAVGGGFDVVVNE